MTPRDYDAFVEIIAGFAELKGKQLSAPAIELYWRAMKHWPLEEFRAAAEHLLRTCEWMPVPKDFEDLRRAGQMTAGEAWELAFSGATLKPGSRVARAAAICGGQRHMRMANLERDVPHIQRRFFEVYRELEDVDESRESVPQVAFGDLRPKIRHSGFRQIGHVLPETVE